MDLPRDRLRVPAVDREIERHEVRGRFEPDLIDVLVVVHEQPDEIAVRICENRGEGVEPVWMEVLSLVDD